MSDLKNLNHLGLILDGNRTWAKNKKLPPWEGHKAGAKNLEIILDYCMKLDIPQVTAYTLSIENVRNRPKEELYEIYGLLNEYIKKVVYGETGLVDKHEVKVTFVGKLDELPPETGEFIKEITEKTKDYQKKKLNLLTAYDALYELKEIFCKFELEGKEITEENIQDNLPIKDPVDLIIRTKGEHRLSGFLPLQSRYAEVYFTKKLWPDFTTRDLRRILKWYFTRERNFGR